MLNEIFNFGLHAAKSMQRRRIISICSLSILDISNRAMSGVYEISVKFVFQGTNLGSPRDLMLFENTCSNALVPSQVRILNSREKILVNVDPTPFVPATSLSSSSLKFDPAFRFEKIISGIHSSCSACFTTGIPPLSQIFIMPVLLSTVTFISFSFELLLCSSTEFETISSKILRNAGLYVIFLSDSVPSAFNR